jgi:uncharacterized membrane protein
MDCVCMDFLAVPVPDRFPVAGTVFFNRALANGPASAVVGLSAGYPAITLLLSVMMLG